MLSHTLFEDAPYILNGRKIGTERGPIVYKIEIDLIFIQTCRILLTSRTMATIVILLEDKASALRLSCISIALYDW
jgi:hypothetical protein